MSKVIKLRCAKCQKLCNTLIQQKCFKCYDESRRPTHQAKKGAKAKIKPYYCLDGRRAFNKEFQ